MGAAVGVSLVAAMASVWAIRGYPDFFFRSPAWALIGALMMAIGGAFFGLLYGAVLAFISRSMAIAIRPRVHFYFAIFASIFFTAISCELSLQRGKLVNPMLVLAGIVGCSFVAAIATSRKI